jgi:hypothetical protein
MRRRLEDLFRRNETLRLVLAHAGIGALLGLAFAVALVVLDAHGIGALILNSESGAVAFLLLAGGFMVTFGSLVAGSAVMLLPRDGDDGHGGGGGGRRDRVLVPIPVRSRRRG